MKNAFHLSNATNPMMTNQLSSIKRMIKSKGQSGRESRFQTLWTGVQLMDLNNAGPKSRLLAQNQTDKNITVF